ncbi:MAG: hypothetical protein QW035_04075 [Candidatus Anstonellales archaeon]
MEEEEAYPYIEHSDENIRKAALFFLYGKEIPKEIRNRYKMSYERTFRSKKSQKGFANLIKEGRFEEAIEISTPKEREVIARRMAEVKEGIWRISGALEDARKKGNFELFERAIKILGEPKNLELLDKKSREEIRASSIEFIRQKISKDITVKKWLKERIEELRKSKFKKELLEDIELVLENMEHVAAEFSKELSKAREEILRENMKRINEHDGAEDKELEKLIAESPAKKLLKLKLITDWKEVDEGNLDIELSWVQKYKVRMGIAHYMIGKEEYISLVQFKRKTWNGRDGQVEWRDLYMIKWE